MSYNGSGTFVINTAGQPVVSGTVISSTAFNALTADLATGLSTAITKDGQTTPTANIPMGNNKITNLAVGTAATDAANLSQVQSTTAKLVNSISGADTITGTMSPTLGAYATGQMFYFVAAGDNTGAVTLNIDSLGAKAVTRDGSVALAASDIKSGEVVVVVYDGTRFQVVSQLNSSGDARFANVSIASALNVGGVSTLTGAVNIAGAVSIASSMSVVGVFTATGSSTLNGGVVINEPGADADTRIEGDTDANLVFVDASTDRVGFGTSTPSGKVNIVNTASTLGLVVETADNPISGARYAANADGAVLFLSKSRNATVGSHTIVQSGDELGAIFARGSNGTSFVPAASISFAVDGTPGSSTDMPGRIVFSTSPDGSATAEERLRITASGNVGIGTTTPAYKLQVVEATAAGAAISTSSATASTATLYLNVANNFSGVSQAFVQCSGPGNSGTSTLIFGTAGAAGDTTATERARISAGGYSKFSNDGTYFSSTGSYHEFRQSGTGTTTIIGNQNTSVTATGVLALDINRNTTNNTFYAFAYYNRAADVYRFYMADSGNLTNTNGSYGTISDAKMKTDIVDAGSQWDDLKAVRFRKFKMKDDPAGLVQLGVVAQELEQTSPGLVDEHTDRDAEGNDLGTTTKSVKTSVLLMKAAVALQEAMARIESLEAKVSALEAK